MSFGLGGSQTSGVPESGIGGFLNSLLGSLHQVNSMHQDSQMRQLQVSEAQKAAANQQIEQLNKILKANPNMQRDQKMIDKMNQLSKVAGRPDPTTTPAVDQSQAIDQNQNRTDGARSQVNVQGGQPQVGGDFKGTNYSLPPLQREQLDMNVLAPPVTFQDIDQKTKQYWASLQPGAQRDGAMAGVPGVDAQFRSMPATITNADKTQIYKDMRQISSDVGKGNIAGPQAAAELQDITQRANAAGISTDRLIEYVTQSAATGPETQAKIAAFYATTQDKNARAAYEKMLTKTTPDKIAAMIRQGQQRADALTENAQSGAIRAQTGQQNAITNSRNADTNAAREQVQAFTANNRAESALITAQASAKRADAAIMSAQASKQRADQNGAKASLVQLNTAASQLNRDYSTLEKQYSALAIAGGDPEAQSPDGGPSLGAQMRDVKTKLDTLTQQQFDTTQYVQSQGSNFFRGASGNSTAQIGDSTTKSVDTQNGRFQQIMQNGQAAGVLDTQSGNYTPFGGATQPQGGTPAQGQQQPQRPGVNAGPKLPPSKAPSIPVGTAPKDMKPGTVEYFRALDPQTQVKYLQSDKVPADVKSFLRTLVSRNDPHVAKPEKPSPLSSNGEPTVFDQIGGGMRNTANALGGAVNAITHGGSEGANPKGNNLPSGLLSKIEQAESSGGHDMTSPVGAQGPFQFMPGTAAEYGVTNPHDVVQSARGAAKYLSALGSQFHGDWAKAVAGYNAGGGAVSSAVRKYGEDWLQHMPKETQHYVAEVLVGM